MKVKNGCHGGYPASPSLVFESSAQSFPEQMASVRTIKSQEFFQMLMVTARTGFFLISFKKNCLTLNLLAATTVGARINP